MTTSAQCRVWAQAIWLNTSAKLMNASFQACEMDVTVGRRTNVMFSYILLGIIGSILFVLGLAVNFIAGLFVMASTEERAAVHIYLVAIMCSDCTLLVFEWFAIGLTDLLHMESTPSHDSSVYFYPYGLTLMRTALTLSCLLVMLAATERYVANYGTKCWKPVSKFATAIVLTLLFGSIFLNLCSFFESESTTCCDLMKEKLIRKTIVPKASLIYTIMYTWIARNIISLAIPFLAVAYFTVKLFQRLASTHEPLKHCPSLSALSDVPNQNDAFWNKIFLYIFLKFLFCQTLRLSGEVVIQAKLVEKDSTHYSSFVDVVNFVILLNAATNGMLYLICRRKYQSLRMPMLALEEGGSGNTSEVMSIDEKATAV